MSKEKFPLNLNSVRTRTTRTPAFWGYPPPPHDYPYHWVILDPKSKEDKVKVTNFKKSPINFWILKWALHTTHLLKLLNKMCKYEMDPMSIVEDTERTRFCPQTDKVIPVYPPFNFVEAGGIKIFNLEMGICWILLKTSCTKPPHHHHHPTPHPTHKKSIKHR